MTKEEKTLKVIQNLLADREISNFRIYKYEGEVQIMYDKSVKLIMKDDDTDNSIVPEEHLD